MTYEELWHRLTAVYEADEARAVARWVLDVRFGLSLTAIVCGKVTQLSADDQKELEKIVTRLEKAEPVQYVLGVADFCGRQLHVASGVLIPRPETEELCRWIVAEEQGGDILDIGTGSGCIAITLALDMAGSRVSAWDISESALAIARDNATRLGAHVLLEQRDALQAPDDPDCWDIIVSNPPYIDETEERAAMAPNVLDYEPSIALFAPTGHSTLFYERIGDYAIRSLRAGGRLYFELNPLTAEHVASYLEKTGFEEVEIRPDANGKSRMLKATKPYQQ
ncbi:MAG: peptide chain release factor N(5)-glutamine methyltransferase [Prevotella sp.]|nr:peptide chain release factor N(5)-glutamine methyltransferase [Prevotella sp.]